MYGKFSELQICFCGLDSGNLKIETVRTKTCHNDNNILILITATILIMIVTTVISVIIIIKLKVTVSFQNVMLVFAAYY